MQKDESHVICNVVVGRFSPQWSFWVFRVQELDTLALCYVYRVRNTPCTAGVGLLLIYILICIRCIVICLWNNAIGMLVENDIDTGHVHVDDLHAAGTTYLSLSMATIPGTYVHG